MNTRFRALRPCVQDEIQWYAIILNHTAKACEKALDPAASMLLGITVSRAGSGVPAANPVLDGQRCCVNATNHTERGEDHVSDCLAPGTSTGTEVEEGLKGLQVSMGLMCRSLIRTYRVDVDQWDTGKASDQ